LTANQFRDFWSCCLAGIFIGGQQIGLNVNQDGQQDLVGGSFDAIWKRGQKNRDRSEKDPDRVGVGIMTFMRILFEAQKIRGFAGHAVRLGVLQPPVTVAYADSTKATNPFSHLALFDWMGDVELRDGSGALEAADSPSLTPRTFLVGLGQQNNPASATIWAPSYNAGIDTFAVLHSVWKTPAAPAPGPNNRVVLVLVNWTNADAEWSGTFTPSRYGLGAAVAVTRRFPNLSTASLGSAGPGAFTIGTLVADTISLGTSIPAHSVDVLEISLT
jgi:hypothetical protein